MKIPKLGDQFRDKETKKIYTYFTTNAKDELVMVYTVDHYQMVSLEDFWSVFESV